MRVGGVFVRREFPAEPEAPCDAALIAALTPQSFGLVDFAGNIVIL
jgi:hypothetical protein